VDQGPRLLALRPLDHAASILRHGPWLLELSTRTKPLIMLFYIYHDGVKMKFRKGNTIGMVTRFGPDWPCARCGAKTQSGEPCKKASMKGRSRCRNHGGCATGPRTEAGRVRIAAAHIRHGRLTQDGLRNLVTVGADGPVGGVWPAQNLIAERVPGFDTGARPVCDDAQAAQTTEIPPNWAVPLQ
jgi:hypothetical protein